MNEEVYQIMLNGMPVNQFLGFLGWALLGAVMFLMYGVYKGIQKDEDGFSWKKLARGAVRFFMSLLSLAVAIVFWDQISMFVFAVEEPVELTGWSAFLIGTMVDGLVEKLLGGSKEAVKYMPKKKV